MPIERTMADVREPVVVFNVGMRINRLLSLRQWIPVSLAMAPMLRELFSRPDLGMLGARTFVSGRVVMVSSYWRSFEALEAYARADELTHRPAWAAFYRRAKAAPDAVGIFHETYLVEPGTVESLYVGVPKPLGLGQAVGVVPVGTSSQTARQRKDHATGSRPHTGEPAGVAGA